MTNDITITKWRDVMLRMQQAGRRHPCAVITLTVIVEHGEPVHWSAPDVHQIEPQAAAHAFLEMLRGVVPVDGSDA